jgi:hypothetical protein
MGIQAERRRASLLTKAGGRRRAKGLCFIRFPVSNSRSLPTHARREHFPLDARLFCESSFSNFPLLHSSRSGVLCHPTADPKHFDQRTLK